MALRQKIRTLAGTTRTKAKAIAEPLSPADQARAIEQLQETVNELITRYNAHAVSAHASANLHTGAVVADTALFTPLP